MLSFEIYTALKLSSNDKDKKISLTKLTVLGVSLSVFVVLMSMSIIRGFKKEIKEFVYSQSGHVSLYAEGSLWGESSHYMFFDDKMYNFFKSIPHVKRVMPVVQSMAIIKTKNDFDGVSILGFDGNNYPNFYKTKIDKESSLYRDSVKNVHNPILLPDKIVSKLGYKLGDKVLVYFNNQGSVKVRSFTLCGIYNSVGSDLPLAIVDISTLRNVCALDTNRVSRVMIEFDDDNNINKDLDIFSETVKKDGYDYIGDNVFFINTAKELMPNLFDWLNLLDTNVYFIFILMALVAGFTMVTGFIILILDKSKHISILKSLGSTNISLQRIFILLSSKIAIKGIFIGNVLYGILFFLQSNYHLIKLDSKSYYVSYVPLSFSFINWILVNIISFILILLFTIYPSFIIKKRMFFNSVNQ